MNTLSSLPAFKTVPSNVAIRSVLQWSLDLEDRPYNRFPAPMTNVLTEEKARELFCGKIPAHFFTYKAEEVDEWCKKQGVSGGTPAASYTPEAMKFFKLPPSLYRIN